MGFTHTGAAAIDDLAVSITKRAPRYARGATSKELRTEIAQRIISAHEDGRDDLANTDLERMLEVWFDKQAVPRTFIIPCTITTFSSPSFTVGPVQFTHRSQFEPEKLGLPAGHQASSLAMEQIDRALNERHACWVATVTIEEALPSRAADLADIAVDVAIAVLQLILPAALSRQMTRVTARTAPPLRGSVSVSASAITAGIRNDQPCLGWHPADFAAAIEKDGSLRDFAGMSLQTFVSGKGLRPTLDRAWCDAAYWFHEGLAEPLDTLAAIKLETAIEVLLRSEATKNSGPRIETAIGIITGLKPDEPISEGSALDVKQFAKRLVSARSRVLHGTMSTLSGGVEVERQDLTAISRLFLRHMALALGLYRDFGECEDATIPFLEWMETTGT